MNARFHAPLRKLEGTENNSPAIVKLLLFHEVDFRRRQFEFARDVLHRSGDFDLLAFLANVLVEFRTVNLSGGELRNDSTTISHPYWMRQDCAI